MAEKHTTSNPSSAIIQIRFEANALQALAADPMLAVTFLGVTRKASDCENGRQLNAATGHAINFTCLEERHFVPEVITFPT